jgi:hypothetical protein
MRKGGGKEEEEEEEEKKALTVNMETMTLIDTPRYNLAYCVLIV